jgi:hypothetical protein
VRKGKSKNWLASEKRKVQKLIGKREKESPKIDWQVRKGKTFGVLVQIFIITKTVRWA